MKFVERIVGMFTKPDETTKDIVNEPRIEEGLLIVGIYMILMILATYLSLSHIKYTGELQGISASAIATMALIMGIIMVIIEVLVAWPILTGVVHIISMFFGGAGKLYPQMMTLIGYTALPLIIFSIISIALSFMMPVTTVDVANPAQSAASSVLSSPLTIVSLIVTLIGSIITAYMMAFAVKNGEKISMGNAYIVVGVLFVINLAFTFGSVIMAMLG
jgi:hypothetical protein